MPRRTVDGVDFGNVLPCSYCNGAPEIQTGYVGTPPDGPFLIKCWCGATEAEKDEYFDAWNPRHYPNIPATVKATLQFYRSWYKTRVVRGWNEMQRRQRQTEES